MKKGIVCSCIFFSTFFFSQTKDFEATQDGFAHYTVNNCEKISKEKIYGKIIEWVINTYKNPNTVVESKVLNDNVKINYIAPGVNCITTNGTSECSDIKYKLRIAVKDFKYKFEILELEGQKKLEANTSKPIWVDLFSVKAKPNDKILEYFNNLNKSLYNYITNGPKAVDTSDW